MRDQRFFPAECPLSIIGEQMEAYLYLYIYTGIIRIGNYNLVYVS